MDAIDDIVNDFELLGDWDQRYQYLVELGERLPEMPAELRSEEHRVKACMSRVWVAAYPDPGASGLIRYHGDCDTAIIKGVVGLLVELFSGLRPQQVMELALNGLEIIENIRMVELEIVHHQRARMVMHELAALIEKRGVIFVGLDDKEWRLAEARGTLKVPGQATD